MKQTFFLFVAIVFLFGAAVVHGKKNQTASGIKGRGRKQRGRKQRGRKQRGTESATLQSIDCSDATSIFFEIKIPDIAQWEGSTDEPLWTLNNVVNEACEPEFDETDGVVRYSDINVATCAPDDPTTTADNRRFEYVFKISVDAVVGSTGDPVTFAYDHDYVVTCFYNREQEDLMASFQPRHSLTDSGSGVEDFIIYFTVHRAFDDSVVDPNIAIDLRTAVYGKIEIAGSNSVPQGLDVHLREVTADNDDTPGGEFSLITDGCGVSQIVTAVTCDEDGDDRFSFEIFRFPGQNSPDQVYLEAKVIVCLESNSLSVCQSECDVCSRRKRRDTHEELQQTEFYVTAGPFKIRDPDRQDSGAAAGEDEGTKGTPFPAYMIAVLAVCGLLAVAIVSAVVLIVFRRRRQNVANVELQNEDSVTA